MNYEKKYNKIKNDYNNLKKSTKEKNIINNLDKFLSNSTNLNNDVSKKITVVDDWKSVENIPNLIQISSQPIEKSNEEMLKETTKKIYKIIETNTDVKSNDDNDDDLESLKNNNNFTSNDDNSNLTPTQKYWDTAISEIITELQSNK